MDKERTQRQRGGYDIEKQHTLEESSPSTQPSTKSPSTNHHPPSCSIRDQEQNFDLTRTYKKLQILATLFLVTATVIPACFLSLATSFDGDEYESPSYILDELGLHVDSSDASIERALVALANNFLSKCSAGVILAITRNQTRVIVPRGVIKVLAQDDTDELLVNVTEDTLFEIGSVSKPLTGLVLVQQVVDGDISTETTLNEPLCSPLDFRMTVIPQLISINGEPVTFGQLASHTSGFPLEGATMAPRLDEWLSNPWIDENPYMGLTETDLLHDLESVADDLAMTFASSQEQGQEEPLLYASYSNFGMSSLAYLLGVNRYTTFPKLQQSLTEQLGMNNTWIGILQVPNNSTNYPKDTDSDNTFSRSYPPNDPYYHPLLSTGHIKNKPVSYWFNGGVYINGAGSTVSSVRDVLRYVEVVMNPSLLLVSDDDSNDKNEDGTYLAEIVRRSLMPLFSSNNNNDNEDDDDTRDNNYEDGLAFGWFYRDKTNESSSGRVYYHATNGGGGGGSSGSSTTNSGFGSYVAFQPDGQTGIVALTNCGDQDDELNRIGHALWSKLFL